MRWLALAVVVAAIVSGCYYVPPVEIDQSRVAAAPDRADEAVAMVAARFGAPLPTVYWYDEDPACGGAGFRYEGECMWGKTGSNAIILSKRQVGTPLHQTSLVHEMAHWQWEDPGHATADIWGADQYESLVPGTRVGDANIALRANGM